MAVWSLNCSTIGLLVRHQEVIDQRLNPGVPEIEKGSPFNIPYPLTPPLSDDSDDSNTFPLDDISSEHLNVVTIHPTGRSHEKQRRLSQYQPSLKRRRSVRESAFYALCCPSIYLLLRWRRRAHDQTCDSASCFARVGKAGHSICRELSLAQRCPTGRRQARARPSRAV